MPLLSCEVHPVGLTMPQKNYTRYLAYTVLEKALLSRLTEWPEHPTQPLPGLLSGEFRVWGRVKDGNGTEV